MKEKKKEQDVEASPPDCPWCDMAEAGLGDKNHPHKDGDWRVGDLVEVRLHGVELRTGVVREIWSWWPGKGSSIKVESLELLAPDLPRWTSLVDSSCLRLLQRAFEAGAKDEQG